MSTMKGMIAWRTDNRARKGRAAACPASTPADERTEEERGNRTAPVNRGAVRRPRGGDDVVSAKRGCQARTARHEPRNGGTVADRHPWIMSRNRSPMGNSGSSPETEEHRKANACLLRPARLSGRLAGSGISWRMHRVLRTAHQGMVTAAGLGLSAVRRRSGPTLSRRSRQGTKERPG